MSDADEEHVIAPMRRRLLVRMVLVVLISCAAIFGAEFILGFGFHMFTRSPRWPLIALVSSLAALVGAAGIAAAWWVTRVPPEFPSTRFTLRQTDRVQRIWSRSYAFIPIVVGLWGFVAALLVHDVLYDGWRFLDVMKAFTFTLVLVAYMPLLTGWGMSRSSRLIYDEELFRSFRIRGYIAGFWSVMAGLLLILALGLARPAWAVEALPVLIASGICVPAVTVVLLNRQAERDA